MPESDLYYIQWKGYNGNCLIWWRIDGKGYTANLDQAWKVTEEVADSICKHRPDQEIAHLVRNVDAFAVRHVTQAFEDHVREEAKRVPNA